MRNKSPTLGRAALVGLLLAAMMATATAPAHAQATAASRALARGDGMGARPDAAVRRLQRVLDERGYSLGPAGVDGRFGPVTERAVRALQRSYGLGADGVVGPKTRKLLRLVSRRANASAPPRATVQTIQAPRPASAPAGSASSTLGTAGPTIVAMLTLLAIALASALWRSTRDRRGPAHEQPAVKRARRPDRTRRRVVGYVGGVEAGTAGAYVEAQEHAIAEECRRRAWTLVDVFTEVPGGEQEALAYAMERVESGEASGLVTGDSACVAPTAMQLGGVLERLAAARACFVALDGKIDTTTDEGALAAAVVIGVTRRERDQVATAGNGHHTARGKL